MRSSSFGIRIAFRNGGWHRAEKSTTLNRSAACLMGTVADFLCLTLGTESRNTHGGSRLLCCSSKPKGDAPRIGPEFKQSAVVVGAHEPDSQYGLVFYEEIASDGKSQ